MIFTLQTRHIGKFYIEQLQSVAVKMEKLFCGITLKLFVDMELALVVIGLQDTQTKVCGITRVSFWDLFSALIPYFISKWAAEDQC